tara:strand:- start:61 stop:828 length:768 start_codon:yes stop_codon:yes gene_type:complete
MRSPLKNTADINYIDLLDSILPAECPVKTFLFFSGNLEMGLQSRNHAVTAHTNKYVIFEFWKCASADPFNIIQKASWLHKKIDVNLIYLFQENWPTYKDPYVRSALFVLLNMYSQQGSLSSGHFSLEGYSANLLDKLRTLYQIDKKINIAYHHDDNCLDCFDKLKIGEEVLIFPVGRFSHNWLDHGKSAGFEEYGVNHKKLKQNLEQSGAKFIVCYDKHPKLFELYSGYNIKFVSKYGIETSDYESSSHLMIYNF